MARRKRRTPARGAGGRFRKSRRRVRRSHLRRKGTWPRRMRRTHARVSRKGWRRRKHGLKGYARARGTRKYRGRRRFLRNPFAFGTRRGGRMELIPSLKELQATGIQGLGAVGTDILVSTLYSVANIRPSQSLVEDAAGRIVGGSLLGVGLGYLFGGGIGAQVRSGSMVVAMYKLIAGVVGNLSAGQAPDEKGNVKLAGFLNNPFKPETTVSAGGEVTKKLMPGLGDLMGVVPEGEVIPVGAVIPEGEVVPLGAGEPTPARFQTRY